jgi:hypothetical protein
VETRRNEQQWKQRTKKTGKHRFYEWWLSKYRNIFELGGCECDEDVGLWVKVYMGAE